jgi:hypothetical protein
VAEIEIKIEIGSDVVLEGTLRTILAPRTVNRISSLFPIVSRAHVWKEEVYFEVNAQMGSEKATIQMKAGDIAYWPQGDALCLFFNAMTPISKVNPVGEFLLTNYEEIFSKIKSGMPVKLSRIGTL